MIITVIDNDTNEEIFNGSADEFLEINSYDEQIEESLNELEQMDANSEIEVYGNLEATFTIIKERDEDLWD